MQVIQSAINPHTATYKDNYEQNTALLKELAENWRRVVFKERKGILKKPKLPVKC